MSLRDNETYFAKVRVMPVLSPISVTSGLALSRALFDAGLRMQEITLRTAAGLDTIVALKQQLPELTVGAGSILTPELGMAATRAGAQFLVSPGATAPLLKFAENCRLPFLLGAATVSEMMSIQALGCQIAKLFPAEALGGVPYLRSVAGPLPSMKFYPTGGIDAERAREYLQLPNVVAVGGSWMATNELVAENRFAEIRRLAKEAAAL